MNVDCILHVKKCNKCQRFSGVSQLHPSHCTVRTLADHFINGASTSSPVPPASGKIMYEIPHELVRNNITQFTDQRFQKFCSDLNIRQLFSSVEHPLKNGLAEATNKVIFMRLKKKLDRVKEHWVKELPEIEPQRKLVGEEKLAPNWEDPYGITEVIRKGAYIIAELSRRELPRSWNVASMRAYYY
ncbi:hypothetical protein Cni_G28970 [Canna indica]|uniref:Integrase catalytic domain-containing protein n=1 Tax=Canna indica TaxID=4628 RepID=A0AAQ3L7G9_9LILI|nr:hypothetical protein Cni_G28970 [Canna indica]